MSLEQSDNLVVEQAQTLDSGEVELPAAVQP